MYYVVRRAGAGTCPLALGCEAWLTGCSSSAADGAILRLTSLGACSSTSSSAMGLRLASARAGASLCRRFLEGAEDWRREVDGIVIALQPSKRCRNPMYRWSGNRAACCCRSTLYCRAVLRHAGQSKCSSSQHVLKGLSCTAAQSHTTLGRAARWSQSWTLTCAAGRFHSAWSNHSTASYLINQRAPKQQAATAPPSQPLPKRLDS